MKPPRPPSSGHTYPLEPDFDIVRSWFEAAIPLLIDHLSTLPSQPAAAAEGAVEAARDLGSDELPEDGEPAADLVRRVLQDYVPRSFNCPGPGYLAYVPGGGLPSSALADLVATLTNRYVGVFAASPLLARLEMNALQWLLDLFEFPAGARGIFTSGGSLATLSAVVCARHRKLGEAFQDGVIYCSDQVHLCVHKAAALAGFPAKRVRSVPSDAGWHLDLTALREAIRADRQAGLRPAMVVGSAGTVNTGTVDDLTGLADLAAQEQLWFHVDGAYGAFFQFTERGRESLRGIERADSIVLDPHKGLFLPYGTGCLLVRRGEDLKDAHSVSGDYLPAMQDVDHAQDFCEYSPELSRDFRGLRVWLSFKIFGASAFRETLEEKLRLAQHAARELRGIHGLEVVQEPELSTVAFYVSHPDLERSNQLTRELMDRLNARKRVFVSGTLLGDRYVTRFCILNFRTHQDRLDEALAALREDLQR